MQFERRKLPSGEWGYIIEDPDTGFSKELSLKEAASLGAQIFNWVAIHHRTASVLSDTLQGK